MSSDVAVRFADTANQPADKRLNVRCPDIILRDCEPYEVNSVRDHVQLVVEVTSEATFQADTTAKRALYAADLPFRLTVTFEELQRP